MATPFIFRQRPGPYAFRNRLDTTNLADYFKCHVRESVESLALKEDAINPLPLWRADHIHLSSGHRRASHAAGRTIKHENPYSPLGKEQVGCPEPEGPTPKADAFCPSREGISEEFGKRPDGFLECAGLTALSLVAA